MTVIGERRPGARRRWLSVAAVAGVAGLLVSCSTTSGEPAAGQAASPTSSATSSAPSPAAPSPTSTTPALVPSADAKGLLLALPELGEIIGDTDLKESQSYAEPQLMAGKIDPYNCRYRAIASSSGVSLGSPAIAGNVTRGVGGQSATQAVAIFDKPEQVAEALKTIKHQWGLCPDGDIFFIEVGSENLRWVPYPISDDGGRLGTTIKRDGLPRNCHHVAVGKANAVVETTVCGDGDGAPRANIIAERILAKIPG